jgi:hypothetical protein
MKSKQHRMIEMLTPKESNVYSRLYSFLHTTPSESNVDMNVSISIHMQSHWDWFAETHH